MIIIPRRAACVVEAAGTDSSRYSMQSMQGVRVREFAGQYWLEATDGRIAAIARGPCPEVDLPAPSMEAAGVGEYIVHRDDWKAAWKLEGEALAFASDGKKVYVVAANGARTSDAVEGRFPSIEEVVKQYPAMIGANLAAGYVKSIAAMSKTFMAGGEDGPKVRLLLGKPGGAVSFYIDAGQAHTLEGLLMPLDDPRFKDFGYVPGEPPKRPTLRVAPTGGRRKKKV